VVAGLFVLISLVIAGGLVNAPTDGLLIVSLLSLVGVTFMPPELDGLADSAFVAGALVEFDCSSVELFPHPARNMTAKTGMIIFMTIFPLRLGFA
jgi:hypothetical protein